MNSDVPEVVYYEKQLKIYLILSAVGFVVGTIIGVLLSRLEYALLGMWIGTGFLGSYYFIPFLPYMVKGTYEQNRSEMVDLKDNIAGIVRRMIASFIFLPIIFSILGPIGFLIRLLWKKHKIKKIKKQLENT